MRALHVNTPPDRPELIEVDLPTPAPGPGELLVKVRCVSLNRRDLAFLHRQHPQRPARPILPCSDMAGRVVGRGEGTTIAEGTAVLPLFLPDWVDDMPAPAAMRPAFGGPDDGVAAEFVVVPEAKLITGVPAHLDAFQAASLPCAGLTAWAALQAAQTPLGAGSLVCVQGTGGVATFAAQFALAMGASVAVVSRGPDKLDRMRELGATHLIDASQTPDWAAELVRVAGGADLIIDHGDPGTFDQAIRAARIGGTVSLVGGAAAAALSIDSRAAFTRLLRIQGIAAGSTAMMRAMMDFIARHEIRPVVGHVFDFAEAHAAFAALERGSVFGKICLSMTT